MLVMERCLMRKQRRPFPPNSSSKRCVWTSNMAIALSKQVALLALASRLQPVQLQMDLDLANAHAACTHADHVVVEGRQLTAVVADRLRI